MKKILLFLILIVSVFTYAITIHEWENETNYSKSIVEYRKLSSLSEFEKEELVTFFLTTNKYNFKKCDKKTKDFYATQLLNTNLKNGHNFLFLINLDEYFNYLTPSHKKEFLKKAVILSAKYFKNEKLFKKYLHKYWYEISEDDFYKKMKSSQYDFDNLNEMIWNIYGYPEKRYKNFNFEDKFFSSTRKDVFDSIKLFVELFPDKKSIKIKEKVIFKNKYSGNFYFFLTPFAENLKVMVRDKVAKFSRKKDKISIVFPRYEVKDFEIEYEIKEFKCTETMYLNRNFGFLNPFSLTLPLFNCYSMLDFEVEVKTSPGYNIIISPQARYVTNKTYSVISFHKSMNYRNFFIAYLKNKGIVYKNFRINNNRISIYSPAIYSYYLVRVKNIYPILKTRIMPTCIIFYPNTNYRYFYPGFVVLDDFILHQSLDALYFNLSNASIQSQIFMVRCDKDKFIFYAGFIENSAFKIMEKKNPQKVIKYREILQNVYVQKLKEIQNDKFLRIFFEGNFLYNYLSFDLEDNLEITNNIYKFPGESLSKIISTYFKKDKNDKYSRLISFFRASNRLPQYKFGKVKIPVFPNGKMYIKAEIRHVDIAMDQKIDMGIIFEDNTRDLRIFPSKRINTLFVYPVTKKVKKLIIDPKNYFLKYPGFIKNYEIEITDKMYEYKKR